MPTRRVNAALIATTTGCLLALGATDPRAAHAAAEGTVGTVGAAVATATGPRCSLPLNGKLQVQSPRASVFIYLDPDCAAAGTDTAQWDIRHRVRGAVGSFAFPTGTTKAEWVVTDSTPLGGYDIVPAGAYDLDGATGPTPVPQNSVSTSLRLRSWLTLGARRSGEYVLLHGLATRWSRTPDAPRPWRHHSVRFWYSTCDYCRVHEMRMRRTNEAGRFSFRVSAPRVRHWFARTDDRPYTWAARPVGNGGDRIA